MTNGSLMKDKSFAECSPWSILQYFLPASSNNWPWKPIFCLFESGCFTQVLWYPLICVQTDCSSIWISGFQDAISVCLAANKLILKKADNQKLAKLFIMQRVTVIALDVSSDNLFTNLLPSVIVWCCPIWAYKVADLWICYHMVIIKAVYTTGLDKQKFSA